VSPSRPDVPRRACLSVPGASERMLTKARGLVVDEIVLDLEDAVRPEDKAAARERVAAVAASPGWACGSLSVRVNAPGTPWAHEDLAALADASEVDAVIVPKVESAGDLSFVDRMLDGVGAAGLQVQALIESAAGLQRIDEIAASSPRLCALVLGYADLAASLGRTADAARQLELWLPVQQAVLTAARTHDLQAIDGPWLGTAVDEAFLAAASRAADLGFDGKWAIHPRQVEALQERFTPTADAVAWAREVLTALDAAGRGAVALDGQMLDEAVAVSARRVLLRAEAAA